MQPYQNIRNFFWIALLPAAWLWGFIHWLRRTLYPSNRQFRPSAKVICVGNVHSGGSGKTPLVIEIARRYSAKGAVVLSRGYRGKLSAVGARVNREEPNGFALYGDEPWMMAHQLSVPIYIGKKRAELAKKIEQEKSSSLLILDDGFQHLSMARDVDLVTVNTEKDPHETFCLPLGELREPLGAVKSASAVVLVAGASNQNFQAWSQLFTSVAPQVPQFIAIRQSRGFWQGDQPADLDPQVSYVAFCGIAHSAAFETEVKALGNVTFLKAFPDHHAYRREDIDFLIAKKNELRASAFLTTDKDWVKINYAFRQQGERLYSLRIEYSLAPDFWYFLDKRLE